MLNSTLELAAASLLALPALAQPVFVEYDTRIADHSPSDSQYGPGDRVAGWLRIDADLAPPDRFADGPPDRQIHSQFWQPGTDFMRGTTGWPAQRFSNDEVSVIDDDGRRSHQAFALWEHAFSRDGGSTILHLQLYSDDKVDDFIDGKGLAQSFDSQDLQGDIKFIGRLTRMLNGVGRTFDLVLNRLSVTPGRCRAP